MTRSGRKASAGRTLGGVVFGIEQQVLRTAPPPQELVHHARPDAPVPAADGTLVDIVLPDPAPAPGGDVARGRPPAAPERP